MMSDVKGMFGFGGKSKAGGEAPSPRPAKGKSASGKGGFVPPPPDGGLKLEKPPACNKTKEYKSSGGCPPMMSFPGNMAVPQAPPQVQEEVKA